MSELFSIEDGENVTNILVHHLGSPDSFDDDGAKVGVLDTQSFSELLRDLLRYCTRLRCQPNTAAHIDSQGYHVPKHRLVADD